MRRVFVLLASAALIASSAVPNVASAGRSLKKQILVPTGAIGVEEAAACPGPRCEKQILSRHHRCAYLTNKDAAQDATTGRFGYTIRLTAAEGDGLHRFKLTDATGTPPARDFDIVFYRSLGSCAGPPAGAAVQPATPPTFAHMGNEGGRIPKGMRYAIVVLFAGAPGAFKLSTTP